jgi:hypothetical protein
LGRRCNDEKHTAHSEQLRFVHTHLHLIFYSGWSLQFQDSISSLYGLLLRFCIAGRFVIVLLFLLLCYLIDDMQVTGW